MSDQCAACLQPKRSHLEQCSVGIRERLHRAESALRQIAKACRDLRRNANLDDEPDTTALLEEIENQLDDLEL